MMVMTHKQLPRIPRGGREVTFPGILDRLTSTDRPATRSVNKILC